MSHLQARKLGPRESMPLTGAARRVNMAAQTEAMP